jgi:hypothetical protein
MCLAPTAVVMIFMAHLILPIFALGSLGTLCSVVIASISVWKWVANTEESPSANFSKGIGRLLFFAFRVPTRFDVYVVAFCGLLF